MRIRMSMSGMCSALALCACTTAPVAPTGATQQPTAPSLVGAWEVTSQRTRGLGKNLLTFSSDGTFFRSGDSHPVLSGAHGAWKRVAPNVYEASYVAFTFDSSGKWSGIARNNLQIRIDEGGNSFKGSVKSSNRDLQENVLSSGSSVLDGRRIQVQPFN